MPLPGPPRFLPAAGPARRSGIRFDHDLGDDAPDAFGGEIVQAVVPGGGGFREVLFLHRPSRTLVVTDLVVNLEPARLSAERRIGAGLLGSLAPHGRAPAYLRAAIATRRAEARSAVARMLALGPERAIVSHGRWFEDRAGERLAIAFDWLLR